MVLGVYFDAVDFIEWKEGLDVRELFEAYKRSIMIDAIVGVVRDHGVEDSVKVEKINEILG